MKVELVPYQLANVDADGRPWDGKHRSKGTHLGDVIRYVGEKLGLNRGTTDNMLFAQSGFVFEAGWRRYAGNRAHVIRQPEIILDRVAMNLDGVCVEKGDEDGTLEEYKATWRSVSRLVDENGDFSLERYKEECWDWDIQTKGYCFATGLRRARVVPLFVNGDYRPPAPMLGVYGKILEFEYSDKELLRNWRMVVTEARSLEREGWTRHG